MSAGNPDALAGPDEFPVLRRRIAGRPVIYLDSAATSLRPLPVLDAMRQYDAEIGANIHRGKHLLSDEASDMYEQVRMRAADFLGARTAEIVFVRNTTEALNTVASGLGLTAGDLVVGVLDAHHSNLLPWRRHGDLRLVPVLPGGGLDMDAYEEALRHEPKVVALSACSNVTGVYPPIEELTKLAKQVQATVVVDAAQLLPHRRFGFREAGADFVAFSGHKMCGPTGVGVLWGRLEALEKLRPAALGGGTVDWVDMEGQRLRKLPHRLEYGTPDIAGVIGFGAALSYLEALGSDAVAGHDVAMARALLDACARRDRVRIVGGDPSADRAGIVSLDIAGVRRLDDVARALSDSFGVMCRSGHMCAQPLVDRLADGGVLRLSTYIYNSVSDIEYAFRALDEVLRII